MWRKRKKFLHSLILKMNKKFVTILENTNSKCFKPCSSLHYLWIIQTCFQPTLMNFSSPNKKISRSNIWILFILKLHSTNYELQIVQLGSIPNPKPKLRFWTKANTKHTFKTPPTTTTQSLLPEGIDLGS
jgi:hypothetical protein